MTKKFIATNLDSFNRMFAQLANRPETVCWIRSVDYNRQLYVSPTFESVFGNSCQSLYENPQSWNGYLLPIDKDDIQETITQRKADLKVNDGNNYMYFRISGPDGGVRYMRDWSVVLCNTAGDPVAIAGVGENICPELWYSSQTTRDNNEVSKLPGGVSLAEIIENEAKEFSLSIQGDEHTKPSEIKQVDCIRVNNITVPLSKREAECLYHLRLGKSAKLTAAELFLSPRTVESHIENIKQKACVRTKIELLSQLTPIETNLFNEG